jgi:cyclophilin family peptidyl-prolyl cis-trans isomerase
MRKSGICAILAGTVALTLVVQAPETGASGSSQEGDSAIVAIDKMIQSAGVDKSKPRWRTSLQKPQVAAFDGEHKYFARMVTNKGSIRIQFLPDVAPMHVTSFMYLTKLGYFDGLSFHRVITGFMAQGGCPLGNGTGGPGYEFGGEFSPSVKHDRPGLLSMANRGPGTDGSQFFLTFVPTPWLDGKHTVFGLVVEGKKTLKALEAAGSRRGKTKEPLKIEKVTIEFE